jgi:hypothetical protein
MAWSMMLSHVVLLEFLRGLSNPTSIINVERQSLDSCGSCTFSSFVVNHSSLNGKAKRSSTIPFEREAEESRNFKLRMIDRFMTKTSMTTENPKLKKRAFCERGVIFYL